jgi:hypothetical protein
MQRQVRGGLIVSMHPVLGALSQKHGFRNLASERKNDIPLGVLSRSG